MCGRLQTWHISVNVFELFIYYQTPIVICYLHIVSTIWTTCVSQMATVKPRIHTTWTCSITCISFYDCGLSFCALFFSLLLSFMFRNEIISWLWYNFI